MLVLWIHIFVKVGRSIGAGVGGYTSWKPCQGVKALGLGVVSGQGLGKPWVGRVGNLELHEGGL